MLYWVIYDISETPKRSKVAEICKDFGLKRIQKSAFSGPISKNEAEMLAIRFKEILGEASDAIFIFQSCKTCFGNRIIIGNLAEEELKEKKYCYVR